MTDVPPVPVTPAAPPTGPQPQLTLPNVPVQKAPPDLPAQVSGIVVSSDPKTHVTVVRTSAGDVTLQPTVSLPPGLEVTVQVYADKAQLHANIVIQKNINLQSRELEKLMRAVSPPKAEAIEAKKPETAAPPPPLQEGKTVTALLLPEKPLLPVAQIAQAIEQLKTTDLKTFKMILPPQVLQTLLDTPDIEQMLLKMPQQQLQKISDFVFVNNDKFVKNPAMAPLPQTPDILNQWISAYAPHLAAAPSAPIPGEMPDLIDNNLLQIMRAQMHAKITQQVLQPQTPMASPSQPEPVAKPMPLPAMLQTIISALETSAAVKSPVIESLFQKLLPAQPEPLLPQNMYQLEVVRILPPNTPPEQIKAVMEKIPAAPQPLMQAKIESFTAGGQPILDAGDNHFVLKEPVDATTGSIVLFRSVRMTPEQALANLLPETLAKTIPGMESFSPLLSPSWPALREALQALPDTNLPPAALQAFHNTLPAASTKLAPTALFFLAALKLGTIENWIGNTVLETLRQSGKKDLADRLSGDFARLAGQAREQTSDGWRMISMPLLHDEKLSQMQFYMRHQEDRKAQEKGDGKPATRFLLNLHLSRMGEMQLDGYLQKKNFDMILRTEEKLPFDMRQELMKRFAQGLEQVHMQGGISFQTRQQGWMTIASPSQHALSSEV